MGPFSYKTLPEKISALKAIPARAAVSAFCPKVTYALANGKTILDLTTQLYELKNELAEAKKVNNVDIVKVGQLSNAIQAKELQISEAKAKATK